MCSLDSARTKSHFFGSFFLKQLYNDKHREIYTYILFIRQSPDCVHRLLQHKASTLTHFILWEGYLLLKPGTLYGSRFVHLSLSLSVCLSLCLSPSHFHMELSMDRHSFDGQTFKLVLFEICFWLRY